MSLVVQRILFSLAVTAWGVLCIYFYASGRIVNYLADDFRIYCLIGGLGLCVLGLFNLVTARDGAEGCGHDHDGECDHNHESSDLHPIFALIMMVVPLLFCVSFTKDRYSEEGILRKSLSDAPPAAAKTFFNAELPPYTLEYLEKSKTKNQEGDFKMPLLELYFASSDEEMRTVLEGQKVEVEGRVITERSRNPDGTRLRLYRLFMTCCVADSRPIPVILEFGKEPPAYESSDWVKVTGEIQYKKEGKSYLPVLDVRNMVSSPPPYEEMLQRGR